MLFEVCVQQEVASLLMICFNSLLKDGRSNVQSPLNHNSCQTGVSDHSEGSFPQNKQLCLLVKGIDIPWKTFCSNRQGPSLPSIQRDENTTACGGYGTMEARLLSPEA